AEANVSTDFDLVFSNSLIEHVGGHASRLELAEAVRDLAPRHWVQTPYRYFPLEPHWLFPGMQFMPAAARVQIAAHWPLSHTKPESVQAARRDVLWTELLSTTEMRDLFPESILLHERVAGLTKSLIAVKQKI
ncbi:MAG: methyltransferase type 11, partial [Planctomycetota bacterium]